MDITEQLQGLGPRLAAARVKTGLSQERVARALDVSTRAVAMWESGSIPSAQYVARIEIWLRSVEGEA